MRQRNECLIPDQQDISNDRVSAVAAGVAYHGGAVPAPYLEAEVKFQQPSLG
jgi:hypothetical protein